MNKISNILKKTSYSVFSNFFSLILSTLITLIVPKIFGIDDYGFWQLYLFYSSYVGILHFGWCDGLFLRYGEYNYDELDRKIFSNQIYCFIIFQIILSLFLIIIVYFSNIREQRLLILFFTIISVLIVNLKTLLLYILQFTDRIKEYSILIILEKILFFITLVSFVILQFINYKYIILADLISKIITLCISIYFCKELFIYSSDKITNIVKEIYLNISVGIKLMIGNLMGSLILGIIKLYIEQNWSVSDFAKISFALTISNMILTFINSVSIVFFPMLKRMSENTMNKLYLIIKEILLILMIFILIFIFPLRSFIFLWLPQYKESIIYMILLVPMCIYECKMSLLIATYMKALRLEKYFLLINTFSVLVVLIFINFINSIYLLCFFCTFIFMLRCYLCEIILDKYIKKTSFNNKLLEIFSIIVFYFASLKFNLLLGALFYGIYLFAVFFMKKRKIKNIMYEFKNYIN